MTMKDLPKESRPYEKCQKLGPEALTDAELLSIIIRTGAKGENSLSLAENILSLSQPKEGILGLLHLSLPELMRVKGIGHVKGTQLLCIGELSKRIWKKSVTHEMLEFKEPGEIADYYLEDMRHLETEQMRVMFLNNRQRLVKEMMISQGTVNASLVSPREILIEALRYQAVYLVMVHNHPSGNPTPSREDCLLTRQMKEAAALVGIRLLDHIIIGDNEYISLKERGIL